MVKHYQGDDGDLKLLMGAVTRGIRLGHRRGLRRRVAGLLRRRRSPDARPPVRRLRLRADGRVAALSRGATVHVYIASGGDRDFMRPVAGELYGVPPERVIGSAARPHLPCRGRPRPTCSTRPRWTSSTTGRRNRSGSGVGSVDGRSCRSATPTATCRCSLLRRSGPPVASAADPARRRRARIRLRRGRRAGPRARPRKELDRGKHEERLDDGLRRPSPDQAEGKACGYPDRLRSPAHPRSDLHDGFGPALPGRRPGASGRGRRLRHRAHQVTTAQYAAFVRDTGYVTVAERPLDPADFPGAPAENLQPGSMVFTPTAGPGRSPSPQSVVDLDRRRVLAAPRGAADRRSAGRERPSRRPRGPRGCGSLRRVGRAGAAHRGAMGGRGARRARPRRITPGATTRRGP